MKGLGAHPVAAGFEEPGSRVEKLPVGVPVPALVHRHRAVEIAVDHGCDALDQVAEIVGEVAVDAVHHGAVREVAVIAERNLAQQEVAHLVEPVALDHVERIDDVADRFRDLLALVGPPSVREDPLGRIDARAHQEGRPVDRVEAQDILAHHVKIARPIV